MNASSQAAENAAKCVTLNKLVGIVGDVVTARVFPWGWLPQGADLHGAVDVIICADCLFFEDFHGQLLDTIWTSLRHVPASVVSLLASALFSLWRSNRLARVWVCFRRCCWPRHAVAHCRGLSKKRAHMLRLVALLQDAMLLLWASMWV